MSAKIQVVPVASWGGLRVNNGTLPKRPGAGITLHHTTTANRAPFADDGREREAACQLARTIQQDHMGTRRGTKPPWRDSGHHFLISRGGVILEGRNGSLAAAMQGRVLLGAHATVNTANATTFGIENEGLYDTCLPQPAHWAALVNLCAWLAYWCGFPSSQIEGHRHYKTTDCPGEALFGALPKLRHDVHDRLVVLKNA